MTNEELQAKLAETEGDDLARMRLFLHTVMERDTLAWSLMNRYKWKRVSQIVFGMLVI